MSELSSRPTKESKRSSSASAAQVTRSTAALFGLRLARERTPTEALAESTGSFYLAKAGEVWTNAADLPLREAIQHYFERLVETGPQEPEAEELRDAVERLLGEAAIINRPGFRRNIEVPSTGLETPESYKFEYAYENGRTTVAQRVPLVQDYYVHDALWKYDHIPASYERVSFVQDLDRERRRASVKNLMRRSHVVDVASQDAGEVVLAAFGEVA
jgi:hypothetical protein